MEHGGEAVARGEVARDPAAIDLRSVFQLVQREVILVMRECPWTLARDHRLEGGIRESRPQSAVEAGLDIAHALQFAPARGGTPARIEPLGGSLLDEMLGRERATADRLVHALDLRHVQRARRVADHQQSRRVHPRQRLPAARGDRARAVGQEFAAFEQRPDARVMLELLESLERP